MAENAAYTPSKQKVIRYLYHTAPDGHPIRSAVTVELESFPANSRGTALAGEINLRNGKALRAAVEAQYGIKNLEISRGNPEPVDSWQLQESQLKVGEMQSNVSKLYTSLLNILFNSGSKLPPEQAAGTKKKFERLLVPSTLYYNYVYITALLMGSLTDENLRKTLAAAEQYKGYTNLYINAGKPFLKTGQMVPSTSEALNLYFHFKRAGFLDDWMKNLRHSIDIGRNPYYDNDLFDAYRAKALKDYYVPYLRDETRKITAVYHKRFADGLMTEEKFKENLEKIKASYINRCRIMEVEPLALEETEKKNEAAAEKPDEKSEEKPKKRTPKKKAADAEQEKAEDEKPAVKKRTPKKKAAETDEKAEEQKPAPKPRTPRKKAAKPVENGTVKGPQERPSAGLELTEEQLKKMQDPSRYTRYTSTAEAGKGDENHVR